MKTKSNTEGKDKISLTAISIISLLVIATGTAFSLMRFMKGDVAGGVTGALIAIIVLVFAIFVFIRGNRDMKKGFPLRDERSKKIIVLAGYKTFLISIWYLLILSWIANAGWIQFRDVSQALGAGILGMAIIFGLCWLWVNRKAELE